MLVTVTGRVDHTNAEDFIAELTGCTAETAEGGGMVIDLTDLEFITSAGLRALLLAQRALEGRGAKLVISGVAGVVREVFRISKFDALMKVADTARDALAELSESAAEAYGG